ncbi:MAG TPA: transketolase C-terminal domain-containing protein, partial [Armatimonadota bacterium]
HSMSGGQFSCPLVLRGPGGPGVQLAAQHSQSLEAWFVHTPGLKVASPATPADAKGLLKTAIRDDNPVLFLEHGLLYNLKGEVPEGDHLVPFGVAEVKRPGRDATIITYSRGVHTALKASDLLAQEGVECEVLDLRTLSPMDLPAIVESLKRTHRAVIVEECWKTCGIGAEISARIYEEAFDELDAPVVRVSGLDVPMPYARNLEKLAVPGPEQVVEAIRKVTWRQTPHSPSGNGHNVALEHAGGAVPEPALAE